METALSLKRSRRVVTACTGKSISSEISDAQPPLQTTDQRLILKVIRDHHLWYSNTPAGDIITIYSVARGNNRENQICHQSGETVFYY